LIDLYKKGILEKRKAIRYEDYTGKKKKLSPSRSQMSTSLQKSQRAQSSYMLPKKSLQSVALEEFKD